MRGHLASGPGLGSSLPGWGRSRGGGGGDEAEDEEWIAFPRLGHPVWDMVGSPEEICLFSPPIRESEIIEFSWGHPPRMRF